MLRGLSPATRAQGLNGLKGYPAGPTLSQEVSGPETNPVSVTYRVRTKADGWLPEVTNLADYAGFNGAVTDVAIRVSEGFVNYRVHNRGGNWLPYVMGCDPRDPVNGFAGTGLEIDAIELCYTTAQGVTPRKRAKYRTAPVDEAYYPWQYDDETVNGQDGYAGSFGKPIGRLQIVIE